MSVSLTKLTDTQLCKRVADLTHERDEIQRKHDDLVITSATVISELQGKVEALAVESGQIKVAAILLADEAAQIYKRWNLTQQPDGDIIDAQTIHELMCEIHETPATKAAIAEIEARGVEKFAQLMHADISVLDALEFAQELRKESGQ